MTNALILANTVLFRAFNENKDITPMKLQKLIYFIYKKYLKETELPLFSERFEAWQYGPVLTSVYDGFKVYGSNHIKNYYIDKDSKAWIISMDSSDELSDAFDYVWDEYSDYDGIYLSTLTHKVGTAWYKTLKNNNILLEDKDIKEEEWYH
ncbi:MAG: DUF4065 domain-containing protein [Oscillospiraceae bacterium]|nr:DUF4065 domain-containing protein [Oscillospiraceae bacterium]